MLKKRLRIILHKPLRILKLFLARSRDAFETWVGGLAKGELTSEEFTSLVKGQLDVAELHALKQAGLAQARVDEFKQGVLNIITTAVTTAIGGLI